MQIRAGGGYRGPTFCGASACAAQQALNGYRGLERRGECHFERLKREGLDEIRRWAEVECLPFRGEDAREDDRATEVANVACESHAREVAGLDHGRIDVWHRPAVPVGVHNLVPKPPDDMLQERTNVGMRFNDQDARHTKIIRDRRRDPGRLRV